MLAEPINPDRLDIPSLIRGRCVMAVGRFASMNRQELSDLLDANGARYTVNLGRGVSVVIVGQQDWPVTANGTLPEALRAVRRLIRHEKSGIRVVSEEQFLTALGLSAYRESVQRLYTVSTLTELLDVPREQLKAWVTAGLIRPAKIEYGVWFFDFRQVTAAKRLWELVRSGVPLRRLRLTLEQLCKWMPDCGDPLQQLTVLEQSGQLLIRLEEGDLSALDGQLHFDFQNRPESVDAPPTLRLVTGPTTAQEWKELGAEQEQAGYLDEAAESYREALAAGGPDASVCFDLANVLKALGHKEQALERYRQAVEIEPNFADAWNNLGTLLAGMEKHEEAVRAFRRALIIGPEDIRAHFNLGCALDELGRNAEAAKHWKAYLRFDTASEWASYARQRLTAS